MKTFLKRFVGSDRGASMVEYGLMVALVALIAIPGVAIAERQIQVVFDDMAASLAADEGEGAGDETPAPGDDDDTPAPGDDDDDTPGPGDDDDTPGPGDDDDDTPGPGDDDDTPGPGDDDDAPGPGDDDDTPGPGDDDDTPGPGDDDDDTPGPGDDDDGTPAGEPGSEAVVSSTDSSFFWWNDTKHGGNGAWKATVQYQNDHNRHQYLALKITRTDDRGNTTTSTVNGFYVPANGSATYELWDNSLQLHKGKTSGVLSVEVQVTSITTSDENWQPVTYPQYDKSTTVDAPKP